MAEHVFIRLTDDPVLVSTVVLDDDGHLIHGLAMQPLEAARGLAEGRRTTVLVPGESIVTTVADVPRASPARLRQMLAYSLEDSFAEDIEDLLFAAGPRLDSNAVSVSVVARRKLDGWIERLNAAGISPVALNSVSEGVPDTPSTVNLVLEGTSTMGRCPGEAPFLLDDLSLSEVWDLVQAGREDTVAPKHVMVYLDRAALEYRQAELDELRSRVASLDVRELPEGCLPRLASTLVFSPGTNLLQGPYAPKSNVRAMLRPWRAAAGLALGLLAVSVAGLGLEYLVLLRDDRALTAQTTEICTESFGSVQITACRAEMQRRLSNAGQEAQSSDTSFLATLAVVAEAAAADARIDRLDYRDDELSLELIVPSVENLDAFRGEVATGTHLDVQILTYTPEDSGVKGRVRIGAGER